MVLHKDKESFDIAIRAASRHFNVSPAMIEKDYYVTLVLCELAKQVPTYCLRVARHFQNVTRL